MNKPSIFFVAYHEVKRRVLLVVLLTIAIFYSVVYPTDLDSYPILPIDKDIPTEVTLIENYIRFIPTVVQVVLPIVLADKIGLVQLAYVAVSTTIATQATKRLFNNHWVLGIRLGQRPSLTHSKHNMPSGHSSMASCAMYFVCKRYKLSLVFMLLPILLLTMYARVMLNDHTISAVVAGALLGILTAALFTSRRKPVATNALERRALW
jgi:membrane-associated phospholipid phosphatase